MDFQLFIGSSDSRIIYGRQKIMIFWPWSVVRGGGQWSRSVVRSRGRKTQSFAQFVVRSCWDHIQTYPECFWTISEGILGGKLLGHLGGKLGILGEIFRAS